MKKITIFIAFIFISVFGFAQTKKVDLYIDPDLNFRFATPKDNNIIVANWYVYNVIHSIEYSEKDIPLFEGCIYVGTVNLYDENEPYNISVTKED